MSEKLKELLEKINEEGVKQAEEKARAIELKAKKDAEKIINEAKSEAQKIIAEARSEVRKMEEASQAALRQAARDLMLSLKDDIKRLFDKVISAESAKSMTSEQIGPIIKDLIERYADKGGEASDIKVLLKKEDLEKLKTTFIARLKDKIKDGIEFRPSPNINAGFSISFDKGRSFFDFTDEGLKEALCAYLNPELSRLLK